jgi:hypothetical protein
MELNKCGPCGGTGRVLDGEICRFCEDDLAEPTLDCRVGPIVRQLRERAARKWTDDANRSASLFGQAADELERLLIAPVAIMDTRDALGICAPTEDDFPALYARQGKRVRLVLDEVSNIQSERGE